MIDKEALSKKFVLVGMNEIDISNDEKPIIGTQGLATCIGFILYNKEFKRAIVGHVSCSEIMSDSSLDSMRLEIFKILYENKLINCSFDLGHT